MLSTQIRRAFIKYFEKHSHRHLPSSPVVPHDDPTLLFCNAGMNQFKSYFLGQEKPPTRKAVTSQKCVRVGGKHNDLENVGHTTRHLTFFEMLGNFSFGDYFKKEAIAFAWEVAGNVFKLDLSKVWASVYEDDDESYELWKKHLPEDRIIKLGAADNFWQMGDVGPCGPCSELLYDRGEEFGTAKDPSEDVSGERFFEFWNLVFMQYNKEKDGSLKTLPHPSVDTGVGLERIVSLKMGVDTVFETDILRSIITKCEQHFSLKYEDQNDEQKAAFHVISDHLRCLAFAIADGAQPSNLDRGYVLRKVLRRAVRYGRILGAQKPFMAQILPVLVDLMHEDYPELKKSEEKIAEILTLEEEAFIRTLKKGGNLLNQIIKKSKDDQSKLISGDDAFLLKDTYGLPVDEIILMAKDNQLKVDTTRFKELEKQAKELSKKTHKNVSQEVSDDFYSEFLEKNGASEFCGFDQDHMQAKVLGIICDDQWVDQVLEGQKASIVLDKSTFYAEKGGQVGDSGTFYNDSVLFDVSDTQSPFNGLIVHHGKMQQGEIKVGDTIVAEIDKVRRQKIEANHSATHLLHWALQKVLGEHIRQAGSLVEAERLRFDFSHHKALSEDQLIEIEDLVNKKIRENFSLDIYELPFNEVQKKSEIKQFFGEKYGLTVRVVDIDFSKELCGGCHVGALGDIGLFRITKETSIAAGVRRIEALTAQSAIEYSRESEQKLVELSKSLKTTPQKFSEKLTLLILDHKNLQEQLKTLAKERNSHLIDNFLNEKTEVKGLALAVGIAPVSKKELRDFVIQMGQKLPSGVCIVCCHEGDDVSAVAHVSKDLVAKKISAKDILNASIEPINGRGGGKPDFAQAGGTNPSNIPQIFENVKQYLNKQ
ncbi:MAG: Alanine--tRNA ligase [Chlamydiae bacterium]|nr:Alanine--tRNA ligase [Chlamydiota bacterium]